MHLESNQHDDVDSCKSSCEVQRRIKEKQFLMSSHTTETELNQSAYLCVTTQAMSVGQNSGRTDYLGGCVSANDLSPDRSGVEGSLIHQLILGPGLDQAPVHHLLHMQFDHLLLAAALLVILLLLLRGCCNRLGLLLLELGHPLLLGCYDVCWHGTACCLQASSGQSDLGDAKYILP